MHIEEGSKFIQNGDSIIHELYNENDYFESKKSTFIALIFLVILFGVATFDLTGILIYNKYFYHKSRKYEDDDIDVKIDGN